MIDALFAQGSQGVQETDTDIVTHFPARTSSSGIRNAILAADPSVTVLIADTRPATRDVWRADVRAHRIGPLTVAPPWLSGGTDPAATIVIDPQMAFGTGEHATTRGVLRLMQQVVTPDSIVADLGAGSAVLSIAAAKLGSRRVVSIELDPDAAANALENIRVNEVGDRVHFIEGDVFSILPLVAPVNVVFANILSSVLVELLPVIHSSLAPGGGAILSGILSAERDSMLAEISQGEWQVVAEDVEEEWWSVLISRS